MTVQFLILLAAMLIPFLISQDKQWKKNLEELDE